MSPRMNWEVPSGTDCTDLLTEGHCPPPPGHCGLVPVERLWWRSEGAVKPRLAVFVTDVLEQCSCVFEGPVRADQEGSAPPILGASSQGKSSPAGRDLPSALGRAAPFVRGLEQKPLVVRCPEPLLVVSPLSLQLC